MPSLRRSLPAVLGAGLALASYAGATRAAPQPAPQAPQALKSVSVDIPFGSRQFPGGEKADIVNNNCLTCHSVGMVLYQPDLPKAVWEAEVHKMISVYKAPVAEDNVPAIVAYLVSIKGKK